VAGERWYVAHTQPRAEELAKTHLERQGFKVYLPRHLKRRSHARRVDQVAAPLFPRYVFIEMDLDNARWRAVHGTRGVQYLVCNGETPAAVPDGVVDEILARQDERGFVRTLEARRMRKGEPLKIVAGAFRGHDALFEGLSDKERIVVLLNLLGRPVRAAVALNAVDSPRLS
jgi:transcriptional antiterminator RfaH